MVYSSINNQAPEYLKCMLLRQDTESEKRTWQDYDRTGLRTPVVKKYKCRNVRCAAQDYQVV